MDVDEYSDDTSVSSGDGKFVPDATVGMAQDITDDKGVTKECLVEGEGTQRPPKGSRVQVHYIGKLEDDTVFDQSNEPFEFELGTGSVIKGWDLGVATMRRGEKSVLTCAADYAYGAAGSPPAIPANATLRFEVELLSWVDTKDISEARDGSLVKRVIKASEKWDRPAYESTCTVTISTVSGQPAVSKTNEKIILGDDHVPRSLEQAFESMCVNEESEFTVKADGEESAYLLTLHDFEIAPSRWNLNFKENVAEAEKRKQQGNELYKQQRMNNAVRKYEKGLDYLSDCNATNDEEKQSLKAVKLPLLTNLAAVQLYLKNYAAVVERCTEALGIECANAKALLRRAKARTALDSWWEARQDLMKLLEHHPDEKDAATELAKLKQKEKAQDAKDKRLFQKMF